MDAADVVQAVIIAADETGKITPSLLLTVSAGLIGVALGALISGATQHRRWLREARLEAYVQLLVAYDAAVEAAESFAIFARFALEQLQNLEELERFTPELSERWETFRAAEGEWKKRRATVELFTTEQADRMLLFMSANLAALVALQPLPLDHPDTDRDWYIAKYSEWMTRSDHRQSARRRFIDVARIDLAARPLSARLGVIERRIIRQVRQQARGAIKRWRQRGATPLTGDLALGDAQGADLAS